MKTDVFLENEIKQRLKKHFTAVDALEFTAVGGGSINQTFRINFAGRAVFCKLNSAAAFPHLFQKEKAGLDVISKQGVIRVPAVLDCFEAGGKQILLLEWIAEGERTQAFWKKFGEQLASLHKSSNECFGLDEDNYMGSVPQSNKGRKSWERFFAKERLQPMIDRCLEKNLLASGHLTQFEKLITHLSKIFEPEKPSLLHGDLWSGNFMCNNLGEPVLIDPAVYFGHRSMDLAMTTLFGGFRQPFYDAYNYHFPFPSNYGEQWQVCNLYPLLIHLYLFGNSYLPQIQTTLQKFS